LAFTVNRLPVFELAAAVEAESTHKLAPVQLDRLQKTIPAGRTYFPPMLALVSEGDRRQIVRF
jgi:hypothetical protein